MIISIQEELNMEKNCKLLNLKNMKETIVNYSGGAQASRCNAALDGSKPV